MTTTKTCTKCGATKPLDEYGKQKGARNGRASCCKTCKAEYARRYREENREKEVERQRRYREANPETVAEQQRRYREKHRDYVNQQNCENSRDNQRLSLYTAHRRHHPWTPDDDDMVLTSAMTVFQIAVTLNKTYNQVATRRRDLRKLESA